MNLPSSQDRLIYRIDTNNRITWVNESWPRFARGNRGEALMPEKVIGRDILSVMTDETVRQVYSAIISRARLGVPVTFTYRCDAPDKRRIFQMDVRPFSPGETEFVSTLKHEEPRSALALLELNRASSQILLRACSWCQQLAWPGGPWMPAEEMASSRGLLELEPLPMITHGICDTCYVEVMANLGVS